MIAFNFVKIKSKILSINEAIYKLNSFFYFIFFLRSNILSGKHLKGLFRHHTTRMSKTYLEQFRKIVYFFIYFFIFFFDFSAFLVISQFTILYILIFLKYVGIRLKSDCRESGLNPG